ncbi:MAG: hypothetical protein M9911_06805 [Saprospiraceae bacterium]|nr:hypothetical protein [Saprospiraceae bacterium]
MKAHLQASQVKAQTKACKRAFTFPTLTKIELKKSSPSKIKKYATAQPDTTKTEKRSIDNGLQGQTTRTSSRQRGISPLSLSQNRT